MGPLPTIRTDIRTVQLYRKQKDFVDCKAQFIAFAAGIGAGKSFVGAWKMLRQAEKGRLYLVAAPTYGIMHDASFRAFEALGTKLDMIVPASIRRGTMPQLKLKSGAEVLFRSTHNPDHLRGPNLSGIWMDEASLMKEDAYDILIGRLREGGKTGWLTATFTPKGKAHWTYKRFGVKQDDTEMFAAKTFDNPFLPPDFYDKIRKKYSQKRINQELHGEFTDGGGNWFNPGNWPRYHNIAESYGTWLTRPGPGVNGIRKTYHHNECTRILAFDLALNKVKHSAEAKMKRLTEDTTDFNAFGVADLTPDQKLIILDCVNVRIPPEGKAPALAELCRRWRPWIVATDSDMIAEALQTDFRRYRDIPEVRTLEIGAKNKIERCQAAVIHGENGRILLPEGINPYSQDEERQFPWLPPFVDNIASFNGIDDEHDDVPDMLGILGRIADELKGSGRGIEDEMPEVLTPGQNIYGW